jgi:hypothetical protein
MTMNDLCPHCLLPVYETDPNIIKVGRTRWYAPCWYDAKDSDD